MPNPYYDRTDADDLLDYILPGKKKGSVQPRQRAAGYASPILGAMMSMPTRSPMIAGSPGSGWPDAQELAAMTSGGGGTDWGKTIGSSAGFYLGNLALPGAGGILGSFLGGLIGGWF